MKLHDRIITVILLLPAMIWFLNGIINLIKNGLYSYTPLSPFHFKIHTITLLPITAFYLTMFIIIKPYRPFRNFFISFSFIFLSLAVYEFIYGIFMINALMPAPPFRGPNPPHPPIGPFEGSILALLGGVPSLLSLNRRFHFLTKDTKQVLLFLLLLSSFIAVMFVLNSTGFFKQMHLYLSRRTPRDPHNPLWMLSKILCVWMFFPLIDLHPKAKS